MDQAVYCVATMDTKGVEIGFVAEQLRQLGVASVTVDVGTFGPPQRDPGVTRGQMAALAAEVLNKAIVPPWQLEDRGEAVTAMAEVLEAFLVQECRQGYVAGIIGLGGSGGTALITPAMRALPIGLPKLMVSTVAGGDVSRYVGCSDIIMVPSIVDVAGLNSVSKTVFTNAARALAGIVKGGAAEGHPLLDETGVTSDSPLPDPQSSPLRSPPTVAMTMVGVTTPCVTAVREQLEQRHYECLVFHATGTGGRTMEKLVESGFVKGVLDLTTTEVADQVVGGVFPAGEHRFETIIQRGIPCVFSLGALDMVNFGPLDTVPERFRGRKLHVHNAQVTLMRTTPDENRQFARFIADRLNQGTAPWTVLIPQQGVSALDAPGQPFHNPQANAALFGELDRLLETTGTRRIVRLPLHINAPPFAARCVEEFLTLSDRGSSESTG